MAKRFQAHLSTLDGEIAAVRAQTIRGPSPETYLNLSLLYYRAGRFEECAAAARRALELRAGYADALNNIAAAHNALRQWDQGILAAERAIRLDAANQLARNNLAWAKAEKEKDGR